MKVECQISAEYAEEPYARICTDKMTTAVAEAIALLESDDPKRVVLTARSDERIYFLEPRTLELVRTEGREVAAYDGSRKRFVLRSTLQELERALGPNFVRISKSAIVNIRRISHVEASFNGTMELVTKSGLEDYISRGYRKSFRERLGL